MTTFLNTILGNIAFDAVISENIDASSTVTSNPIETGAEVNIDDDGVISLAASDEASIERAKEIIHGLTADVEAGQVYTGKVMSIVNFGIFCEVLPGKEGLCHISEIDHKRIEDIFEYAKENNIKIGDTFQVQVKEVNDRGQIRLSRKMLLPKPERSEKPQAPRNPEIMAN